MLRDALSASSSSSSSAIRAWRLNSNNIKLNDNTRQHDRSWSVRHSHKAYFPCCTFDTVFKCFLEWWSFSGVNDLQKVPGCLHHSTGPVHVYHTYLTLVTSVCKWIKICPVRSQSRSCAAPPTPPISSILHGYSLRLCACDRVLPDRLSYFVGCNFIIGCCFIRRIQL